ncbi:hypothetical protein RJ639_026388 [Escallonia herrerae]|uniref:Secretory carrier-associated membrane protein n=1 Tax=Escallonia herrerae TaxID=1293975 RepID=A0AA88S6U6_9ASTE|nr:hypothetical protein RJ639_026388 [Escallonia herrerae]
MASRYDANPFEEEEVNPFADQARGKGSGQPNYGGGAFYMTNPGSVPPATSRLSPLPHEPADSYRGATVDIPLDSAKDLKVKEKELQAKEAELRKREQELKRREDAVSRAGIVLEEKNWPPFIPIIHHDIANEIPIHLQKLQYVAFTTLLGMFTFHIAFCVFAAVAPPIIFKGKSLTLVFLDSASMAIMRKEVGVNTGSYLQIFYFIGFGFFCLESLISIWQVYMYFRGSGKAAEMRREATRSTMMAAL